MATSKKAVLTGKAREKVVNELAAGFPEWNGDNVVINSKMVRSYLRSRGKCTSLAQAVIFKMIKHKVICKMGQRSDELAPSYLMVDLLPFKPSWTLSAETTSRLVGNCLNYSAEMARMTHKAMTGNINV